MDTPVPWSGLDHSVTGDLKRGSKGRTVILDPIGGLVSYIRNKNKTKVHTRTNYKLTEVSHPLARFSLINTE